MRCFLSANFLLPVAGALLAVGSVVAAEHKAPKDFTVLKADEGAGEVLIRQGKETGSATAILHGALDALGSYFDDRPKALAAVTNGIDAEAQATFIAFRDKVPYAGLAVVHAVERRRLLAVSRRTEDQLACTAELLRVTFDASTNALIAVDRAADVIEWNSTAERLLGWTAAEVRGRDLRGLLAGGHELENLLAEGIAGAGSSQQARACTVQHRHGQREHPRSFALARTARLSSPEQLSFELKETVSF